jgi:hypothetical protein
MVGVGVYFCRARCKISDSIQEVADITFAEYKQSPHYWFIPADSAALTPEPRLEPLSANYDTVSKGGRGDFHHSWVAKRPWTINL